MARMNDESREPREAAPRCEEYERAGYADGGRDPEVGMLAKSKLTGALYEITAIDYEQCLAWLRNRITGRALAVTREQLEDRYALSTVAEYHEQVQALYAQQRGGAR